MSVEIANNDCKLPSVETMNYAWRISIVEDNRFKPIIGWIQLSLKLLLVFVKVVKSY